MRSVFTLLTICWLPHLHAAPLDLSNPGPFTPKEELATFSVPDGFRVELVAAEPNVVDPVAMAFDENGRIFVAEMRGYPNAGVATGEITSGRIRLLTDEDGDGVYETSQIFAEGLRFPTSVMPCRDGLLVANAPDILLLKDTNGDGKADVREVLYTGFELRNIQQLINSFQWALDNRVYAMVGSYGGTITSPQVPEMPEVVLRGRGVRLRPEVPGSLEPTSGGGQYGLAPDIWQRWFTATNSQHLRHIVLPDHSLRRNPHVQIGSVTIDIPEHGAAARVFRRSPFEAWRVERTGRRAGGPDAKRFSKTELVPGGYITSACSPVVYCADRFPKDCHGDVFVCDPANNLIHRDTLVSNGASFIAKRVHQDHEFLASTDNWFRPVWLTLGPDGAIYICDFYREVIETPLSLPDDIKKAVNLESRNRGRIWRVVPDDSQPFVQPTLGDAPTHELVKHLAHPNLWWRLTAQRLLVEGEKHDAIALLQKLVDESPSAVGRAHALWTLHGLGKSDSERLIKALNDSVPGVREQALRIVEELLEVNADAPLSHAVARLTNDPDPRVRCQAAMTLGVAQPDAAGPALAKSLLSEDSDRWTHLAALSSAGSSVDALLVSLIREKKPSRREVELIHQLSSMLGAGQDFDRIARLLTKIGESNGQVGWERAVLAGLGEGMRNTKWPLSRFWTEPPPEHRDAVKRAERVFTRLASDPSATDLLGYGPPSVAIPALSERLDPRSPGDVQLAAVRSLGRFDDKAIATTLLADWSGYTPSLRTEVIEVVLSRPAWAKALVAAVESNQVNPNQLGSSHLERLQKLAPKLELSAGQTDRRQVIEKYRSALELKPDPERGRMVFRKNCTTCHRLEDVGTQVGAELKAALPNKTAEALLIDILDPNREVDPRYAEYAITTLNGQTFTGLLASESATSLTLARAEGKKETVLREQIDEIHATGKSLMPEGFEKEINSQQMADLIDYLLRNKN